VYWHATPAAAVVAFLGTDAGCGLPTSEATRRLQADGPNELPRATTTSALALLAAQFRSVVIWVLIGAALVSGALGETVDAAAILAIVVLNAAIGFYQEHQAERAVAALARLTAPRARVVRDGRSLVVPAAEVVRGDVLLLEGGDLVAADARVLDAWASAASRRRSPGVRPVRQGRGAVVPTRRLPTAATWCSGTKDRQRTGRGRRRDWPDTELGDRALLETAAPGVMPPRSSSTVGRSLLWRVRDRRRRSRWPARATDVLELFGRREFAVAAIPEGCRPW
jgi:Ca2+-transporting ATPase